MFADPSALILMASGMLADSSVQVDIANRALAFIERCGIAEVECWPAVEAENYERFDSIQSPASLVEWLLDAALTELHVPRTAFFFDVENGRFAE